MAFSTILIHMKMNIPAKWLPCVNGRPPFKWKNFFLESPKSSYNNEFQVGGYSSKWYNWTRNVGLHEIMNT